MLVKGERLIAVVVLSGRSLENVDQGVICGATVKKG